MKTTHHVVCYIRKDANLLKAIEDYCAGLSAKTPSNLIEKAYWFLHKITKPIKCAYDGCNNTVKFRSLNDGYAKTCCAKHGALVARPKTIATNIERYNATTPLHNVEIRNEIEARNVLRYGVKHIVESEYFKEKRQQTFNDNYGGHPMQHDDVLKKRQQTCLETYGTMHPLQNNEVKQKKNETCILKYGVENPAQSQDVKHTAKQTFQKNYGVNAPAQCPDIRQKQTTRYRFNGMSFDSQYEIAYFIWLKNHNVSFAFQPDVSFQYEFDGEHHVYMPDFIVENEYVEIKGDHFFKEDGTMQNPFDHSYDALYEAKHQCMLANGVKILRCSELKHIIDYVHQTYGKHYLKSLKNI